MALPTIVQSTSYLLDNGTPSGSKAFPNPVTPGNLLFCAIFDGLGVTATANVSDSVNGVWPGSPNSPAANVALTTDRDNVLLYLLPSTAAGTPNVTVNQGLSGAVQFIIGEISGLATSSVFDGKSNNYSASSTSANTGPFTPSVTPEMLLAIIGFNSNEPTPTLSNGFSQIQSVENLCVANLAISNTTAMVCGFTLINGAAEWAAMLVGLKGPTGTTVLPVRIFANGAFQANAFFSNNNLPSTITARIYLGNNDVIANNVTQTGLGKIRLFSNGQLQVNNTIHT